MEEPEPNLTQEDEGSMAFKLARIAEGPQVKSEEELEAARQEEAVEVQAAEEAAAAETAAEEEAEKAAAAAASAAAAPPEPPKPKYVSIEEAERAANEAASKMHQATEEAARERKARETAETELAEIKAAEEGRLAAEEAAKSKPKLKERYATALKTIQAIPLTRDPDTGEVIYPDDYDDRVAEAWAGTALDPEEIKKEIAKTLREDFKRERLVEDTRTAEERAADAAEKITIEAERMAAEQGLDMTPGSADHRLFYTFVDELKKNPEHEFANKPFEEQVKWATGGVRQVLGKKIELTDAERAAARRNQARNAVLERGLTRITPAEPKKQRSMQEILERLPA